MALTTARALHPEEIDWAALREVYPEEDGQRMAENTRQYCWIQTIVGGLRVLFRDDPDVFVAGDLLWYPVEGHPEICTAPDALVVFGRPKGDRGSYLQFLEGDIPPQVTFEVLSPKNTAAEMARKRAFYERYGVDEYYEYDPDRGSIRGWLRQGSAFEEVAEMRGWISPRLGVRFGLDGDELRLTAPDGQVFVDYVELAEQRDADRQRAEAAEAELAQLRAELARLRSTGG